MWETVHATRYRKVHNGRILEVFLTRMGWAIFINRRLVGHRDNQLSAQHIAEVAR